MLARNLLSLSLLLINKVHVQPVAMSMAPKPVMMEADGADLNRGEEGTTLNPNL